MTDFATIVGSIGAITGVVALIVSIKSYVRVSAMKALDLRLEASKAFDNLEIVLTGIEGYLDYVHKSHTRVLAATGHRQSGEMKSFEEEFERDKRRLRSLLGTQPRRDATYSHHAPSELEEIISSIHAFHVQVSGLRAKYQRLFESDEVHRQEIREQHRH